MMKKYTLVFLTILLTVLAAQDAFAGRGSSSSKSSCDVDPKMKAFIKEMADDPRIEEAVKKYLGKSFGGPGEWGIPPKRTKGVEYQARITGVARLEYKVNGVWFDGYDKSRNVLIDAKDFKNWPIDKKFSRDSVLKEAKRQIEAAEGTGAKIEWRVATREKAEFVAKLFKEEKIYGISVVHAP